MPRQRPPGVFLISDNKLTAVRVIRRQLQLHCRLQHWRRSFLSFSPTTHPSPSNRYSLSFLAFSASFSLASAAYYPLPAVYEQTSKDGPTRLGLCGARGADPVGVRSTERRLLLGPPGGVPVQQGEAIAQCQSERLDVPSATGLGRYLLLSAHKATYHWPCFLQLSASLNELLPNVPSILHDFLKSLLEIDYKRRPTSQNLSMVSAF